MTTRKITTADLIGESFNPELMNMGEVFKNMADELFHYMPDKRSAAIRADLSAGSIAYTTDDPTGIFEDWVQIGHEALNAAEDLLTDWAQEQTRNPYIYFVVSGPFAGFRIDVDSAINEADWTIDDNWQRANIGNPHQPGDGAGLEVFVNDHGNVTAWVYGANGHKRELFSIV